MILNELSQLQVAMRQWCKSVFGEALAVDRDMRQYRFLEEAIELFQASSATQDECLRIVRHVYAHPKGEIAQEIAGTLVTLAALANAYDVSMTEELWAEVRRIHTNEIINKVRGRQATKPNPHVT